MEHSQRSKLSKFAFKEDTVYSAHSHRLPMWAGRNPVSRCVDACIQNIWAVDRAWQNLARVVRK